MDEMSRYEAYKKKLQGICDENDLTFRFEKNTYPITLTIRPIYEQQAQISFVENEENGTSRDAFLMFQYADGDIIYKISKQFVIGDTLFGKIKNLFKNMHMFWLQYFFREVTENNLIAPGAMPEIDEDDADDEIPDLGDLPDLSEPLEEIVSENNELEPATQIVRMENKATVELLQRRLHISAESAKEILIRLNAGGVIDESGNVLPYDEPDDEEGE